ncbi:MAG: MFS transporter [Acidobacteriota bacterium]
MLKRINNDRKIIAATGVSHFLIHSYEFIFPTVLVMVGMEFQIDFAILGILANISYLFIGLGSLPSGYFADRVGSLNIMKICLLGAVIASVIIGFSNGIYMLAAGLTILGASLSLYHPSGLSLISRHARDIGHSFGIHGVSGSMGLALSPFIAGLIAAKFGWRGSYFAFAFLGIMAVAFLFSLRLKEKNFKETCSPEKNDEVRIPERINRKALLLTFLLQMLCGFCYRGVMTFLPAYMGQNISGKLTTLFAQHAGVARGGMATTLVLLVGMFGQYAGGWLSRRVRPALLFAVLIGLSLPFTMLIGLSHESWLILSASLFAFFHFSAQPVSNSLVAHFTPFRWQSLGFGIGFMLGFGFGSFASSFAGFVAQTSGIDRIFIFIGIFTALPLLIAMLIHKLSKDEVFHKVDEKPPHPEVLMKSF